MAAELLQLLLLEHLADPFPPSVEKGEDYGSVDAVMIDADIYGWVMRAARGERLRPDDRARLKSARNDLRQSLDAFPAEARSYYERLVEMASLALDANA